MRQGQLLLNEFFGYLLVQAFGLLCAWKILHSPALGEQIAQQQISWRGLIFSVAVGTILLLLALKFLRSRAPYKIFFNVLFFLGTFYVFNLWLPVFWSLLLTAAIFIFNQRRPTVILHNLIIILTTIWASVLLGLAITPWQMVIMLVILSVYDMIAVWKTKHMIAMFKGLAEQGVIFALVVPRRAKNLWQQAPALTSNASQSAARNDFVFMGTGDLALPLIFAVSNFKQNIWTAFLIVLGALLGIIFIHFVFLNKKEQKPLPALPPLATGAIIGWLIGRLIL
jgi:presenilin-like A22 family membrane protease